MKPMLLKSYNYRPGKIIYDGKDDDFYDYSDKIFIPQLNSEIIFQNKDAKPLWNLQDDLICEVLYNISEIKVITYQDDLKPSYKNNDLDIYVFSHLFPDDTLHIVLAEGESQPARYKIILLGYLVTT
ncbi:MULTISPECIES: hypothetical protein [Enterobacter cloacae complex]|uniref:Uncharacterized protein n=1 Tax=Enterobacter genomosp. O TaxID=2364150 RepID=A0A0X4EML7_9ENTR|nr:MULTISPECIES: hypothetical protein [Enterobacter cloacae complex]KUQ82943.1 hypothetical protein AWI28_18410 [Enterobacter genomosp. O]MCM7109267.1 hypothetical protein [Enterobacter cloacae]